MNYKISLFNFPDNKGFFFFKFGILFLPSALPVGGLFLLIALWISILENKKIFFKDKFNIILIICSGLLLINSIYNSIKIINGNFYSLYDFPLDVKFSISNIYLDLFNWIPLFLSFWGFQYYLNSIKKRRIFAKYLVISTFPVIFSCFAQYFLNWNNTLSIFNGLIIWYQKPFGDYAISGLFSNPNYTGCWLAATWPLAQYLFLEQKAFSFKKITSLFFSCSILFFTVMTNSRNALIGIISSFVVLFRKKLIFKIFLLLTTIIITITLANSLLFSNYLGNLLDNIPSNNVIYKLTRFDFENASNFPRVQLYNIALNNISKRAITGWGAGTFSTIYFLEGGKYNLNHTHNFILEIAYNYGLPVAILLTSSIFFLFFKLFKKKNKYSLRIPINKAWLASCIALIIYQLSDMPIYEGKINIIFWILLAGLKCINEEKELS